jgi:hypothetical protein
MAEAFTLTARCERFLKDETATLEAVLAPEKQP